MNRTTLKYIYTIIAVFVAIAAVLSLWNYYMESPWTSDGRVAAEIINITAPVSGHVDHVFVKNNEKVKKGDLLFTIKSLAQETKEFSANNQSEAQKATPIYAPTNGYITHLKLRKNDFVSAHEPTFVMINSDSFFIVGYFEETKLRNIKIGAKAKIYLYSSDKTIEGKVLSMSHAVYDNNIQSDTSMIPKVTSSVPWINLAQRVPVEIAITDPQDNSDLVVGTSCSISIYQ